MGVVTLQPIGGRETLDGCQHLGLEAFATFEISLLLPELHQELPDEGADGGFALCGEHACTTIDFVWQ
jgi:hypothetical protein